MAVQLESEWAPRYAGRASRMQASEIRELLKLLDEPGIISFAGGIPDPVLFPVEAVKQAYSEVLGDPARAQRALQYSISEGDPGLRDWIADHMRGLGVNCDLENILVTSGSQQALEFLGRLLLSPGDTALVAAPTYLGALQAFNGCEPEYDILRLGMDRNRTAASYRETAESAGGLVKFAYVVPDFANPSGQTMDLAERRELLDLAGQLDCAVIDDSPYSALRYESQAQPSLLALDSQAGGGIDSSRVIHCGSFSKVFTPGLRVGWVCAAREVIARLTLIKQASDLNSPAINQAVVHNLAETMFDNQVARAVAHYRPKRDAMLAALEQHMPEGTVWSRPDGGMFCWVELPGQVDTGALLQKSVSEAKVAFVPGHAFHADGSGRNTMRLSFSLPSVEDIALGIARLGAVLRDMAVAA